MPSDGAKKRRLFVGTFLPEAERKRLGALAEYKDRLAETWNRKIRWVREEKLHLTWVFLGNVDESQIPVVIERLNSAVSGQSKLAIDYEKLGVWPSPGHARHLVLEPNTVPADVAVVGARIRKELLSFTEHPDKHRYRPHITVFRTNDTRQRAEVPDWFPIRSLLPMHHEIDRIDLIESHLGDGDTYESIHSINL